MNLRIGIGGNIGSGKSTVAKEFVKLFRKDGYIVRLIEADKIAWKLYQKSSNSSLRTNSLYARIVKTFGQEILNQYWEIDRRKLARIVFSQKKKLERLNQIVHPHLIKTINNELQKKDKTIKILDAALLFFWRKKIKVDYRILVSAPQTHKVLRMIKIGYTASEVKARIKNQLKEKEMRPMADFVIVNNGSLSKLKEEVEIVYRELVNKHDEFKDFRTKEK